MASISEFIYEYYKCLVEQKPESIVWVILIGRAGLPRAPALATARCLRQFKFVPDEFVERSFAGSHPVLSMIFIDGGSCWITSGSCPRRFAVPTAVPKRS
jgi:hypothetical protein